MRGLLWATLCLVVLAAVCQVLAQDYDYEYSYDSYYDDQDYEYDEYGYYGDDDAAYYEYYGYYADDFAGYEDYYEYYDEYNDEVFEDCKVDANGKVVLANGTASCDLKIEGVDKQADLLAGGLDGIYKLTKCHNGRPMYKRQKSPPNEDRVLWYSSGFGDWDISKGAEANEPEILMYGGEIENAPVPLFVTTWNLGADLKSDSNMGEDDYMSIKAKISCADGKKYEKPKEEPKQGPALTDDEMEAKYRYIYEKYGTRPEPSPTVNFTFVVFLVMTGLTIVLAIPYFLLKKKGGRAPISTSFAQIIQQTKKKSSGHIN